MFTSKAFLTHFKIELNEVIVKHNRIDIIIPTSRDSDDNQTESGIRSPDKSPVHFHTYRTINARAASEVSDLLCFAAG